MEKQQKLLLRIKREQEGSSRMVIRHRSSPSVSLQHWPRPQRRRLSPLPAVRSRPQERASQGSVSGASVSSSRSQTFLYFSTVSLATGASFHLDVTVPSPAPPRPCFACALHPLLRRPHGPWPCLPDLAHLRNQLAAQPLLEARLSCPTVSAGGQTQCPGRCLPCCWSLPPTGRAADLWCSP